ncbi:MAG: hypothetical protein E7603_01920 [Ruminococcaceae bacterium]|nr:hypothetical protein [Oscillospiraceae bacterium]
MKIHTGNLSRVTLSFDMTFFALVRMALTQTKLKVRRRRCFVHPLRKRPIMDDNDALAYTAYVSAVLMYHKVSDTIADDKGIKKLGAYTVRPYAGGMRRRAAKAAYEIAVIADTAMKKLSALEREKCDTPDMPADVFGDMLGRLLAYGLDERNARIAYEIGLHTGRWVYLTDAIFDYENDQKKGNYNPFIFAFSDSEQMQKFKESALSGVMAREADSIMLAVDLIDFRGRAMLRSCIENIIYDGMEDALSIAFGKEQTDGE